MQTLFPQNADGVARDSDAECLEESPDSGQNRVEMWRSCGEMLLVKKSYSDAVRAFQSAIKLNPRDAVSHYQLGIALTGCGKTQEATEAYRLAISLKPDYPEVWNNLGSILEGFDKWAEAERCFERAVQIDQNFVAGLNNLGLVRLRLGRLDEAAALFLRALALQPEHPYTLNNLGMVLQLKEAFEDSIACFQSALTYKPDYPEAYCHLGIALAKCGRLSEAVDAYKSALSLKPDYAEVLNELCHILMEQGNVKESLACLDRVLKSDPNVRNAMSNLRLKGMRSRLKETALNFASNLRSSIFSIMKSDMATALELAKMYGFFLSENHIGIYADNEMEFAIIERLAPKLCSTYPKTSGRIIHLATELYVAGGHTRVIERFLNRGFGDALALLNGLPEYVRYRLPSHIPVYDNLKSQDNVETVKRVMTVCSSYDVVILHIHMYDIISAVAAGLLARTGTKVYLYNHADHCFSFGFAASGKIFEVSKYGWLCGAKRGIRGKQSFVGVPVDFNESIIERSTINRKDIMISGAPHKFIPFEEYNVPLFMNKLHHEIAPDDKIHIIGPTGREYFWSDLDDEARKRIIFHGSISHSKFQEFLASCAVYIDSFPIINGTGFPEAVMAGIPSFGLDLLSGGCYADVLRSHTITDLLKEVVNQLVNTEYERLEVQTVRENIRINQASSACIDRAFRAMKGNDNIPLPSEFDEARCQEFFFERYWLGKSHHVS